jgi:prepilin peptidase CpaA
MSNIVHWSSLGALLLLLGYVVYSDAKRRIISNRVNMAIALLALPWWLTAGVPLWPLIGWQLAVFAAVFVVFAAAFHFGWMGGGDYKLLMALALWLPAQPFLKMLVVMSLAGGVLTLAMVVWHHLRRRTGSIKVPYGCAIAFAAIAVIGEPVVKQFIR